MSPPSEKVISSETDQESGEYPTLVDFDGPDDPLLPFNWSITRRVWVTSVVAILNLIGTVASSIFETGNETFMQDFNISHEVAVLGTSLFLVVSSPFIRSSTSLPKSVCSRNAWSRLPK